MATATVYGLGSGRARLSILPAHPTDRAFFVRIWGKLQAVPELPALVIEPRPFVMEPYPAPSYGPDPTAGWGLAVVRRTAPSKQAARDALTPEARPGSVMASRAPGAALVPAAESLPDAPAPETLRAVVSTLRGRAERCYEATMVPGRVELLLVVDGASGLVRIARATGVEAISRCIEAAALALRFPCFARASLSIQQTYAFR
jgi:hypothetical protein